MKIIKRLLLIAGILLVVLIGAAIALPIIFKDEILAKAKEEINKNVRAQVDFSDVSLSLLRSFPNFCFRMEDFSVIGIDTFAGYPLAKGKAAEFTIDLKSVINADAPISIKSVSLEEPDINILVLENGLANYDITVPTDERIEETAESTDYSGVRIKLDKYSITGGKFVYDDRQGGTYVSINDLNHSGKGDFTIDVYDLDTKTTIGEMTVSQGGITYLKKARADLDAIFNIDQTNSKYTLKDNKLTVNDLTVNAEGFVQLLAEDIAMDLSFSTPESDFKSLFSLIPNAYIQGYESVKVDGQFGLSGNVKGSYNGEKEQYPAFHIKMNVDNGNVKYPDLPLGISNIFADATVDSPSSNFDDMKVDLPRFSLRIGSNPLEGSFALRHPISDPAVDTKVKGVIVLDDLAKAFPIPATEEMSGRINADMAVNTTLSLIESQQYEKVNMSGSMDVNNLKYKGEGLPLVNIRTAKAEFTPKFVQIDGFDADLGKSDLKASGRVDNILAYFSPEKTMTGQMTVRSNNFDLNEWMPEETNESAAATAPAIADAQTEQPASVEIFDRFDFDLDSRINNLTYGEYKIKDMVAVGNMKPNRLEAKEFSASIGESDFSSSGVITNMFDYLFDNGTLGGNLSLRSHLMNLNQFMTAEGSSVSATEPVTEAQASELEPFLVPANIKMNINADIDRLIYTNMELKDLKGEVTVADQAAILENAEARALGGTMAVAGSYDTKDPQAPAFTFKYDLNKLDFKQSFNTFNTFQQLAPIGKFISGNFSSSLILEGELGKNMYPKLSTVNAQGFLETVNSIIAGFKPLQAVGNALNLDYLKEEMKLENTKNWFEIKNGLVEVKPFDVKVKDIGLNISGTHGLNQDMDYKIKARIPRKLLEKGAVGQAANSGFNLLQKEASKLGVSLQKSEFVNVLVQLTGSLADPKVKLNLLSGDGEQTLAEAASETVKDELKAQEEKLRSEAEKKLEEGKAVVNEKVDKAVDTVKSVVTKKAEELTNQAKDKAGELLKDKVGEAVGSTIDSTAKKKLDEVINTKTNQSADDIKKELEKFNPFKKKKKEGGN